MKQHTLYTFGYLISSAERTFAELITTQTPVVDIRYKPTSKHWQYNGEVLSRRDNILYYWIEELGNEHYKQALSGKYSEPRIKLHSPNVGLSKLAAILDTHGRAAIMCACASPATCHRRAVSELAAKQLAVRVIHLATGKGNQSHGLSTQERPFAQSCLWEEKALLTEGLHPQQQIIEREALEHYRRLAQ